MSISMKRVITYHDSSIKVVKKLKRVKVTYYWKSTFIGLPFLSNKNKLCFLWIHFSSTFISYIHQIVTVYFFIKTLKNSNPNRELIYVAEKVCSCRPFPNPRNNLIVPHVPSRSTKTFLVFQFLLFKCRLWGPFFPSFYQVKG